MNFSSVVQLGPLDSWTGAIRCKDREAPDTMTRGTSKALDVASPDEQ